MRQDSYEYILKEIPLFAKLNSRQWQILCSVAQFEEYRKGQIIYKENQPPTGFYCVLRGRVVISTTDPLGRTNILEYLHRGQYFGIISVLTGEPHSVTAQALNDCVLLSIPRQDFLRLLQRIPQLGIDLSTTLSRRLKRKDLHPKTIFESTVIAVLSSYSYTGKTVYAANLSFGIAQQTNKKVIIVDICQKDKYHRMPRLLKISSHCRMCNLSKVVIDQKRLEHCIISDKAGIDSVYFYYQKNDSRWPNMLVDVLSRLVNDYHFIILDLPSSRDKTILRILNQADIIHLLTNSTLANLRRTEKLIKVLKEEFAFPISKIKVIINQSNKFRLKAEEIKNILHQDIYATLPHIRKKVSARVVLERPQEDYSRIIRRIARQEGNCLVGLALGVGVAYGFCHIGVLKVLEEENIPIDVISGSSIGSFIASLWALGYSSGDILSIVKKFRQPKYILNLLDFTFPLLGFIKGNKIYNVFKQYIGEKTFYDVKIPLKIVATDVKKKQPIVFDRGLIIDAIMASCSMPGVFAPFTKKGEMLFDGGVMCPVPTEVLVEMGVSKIIAVNLTPDREDILKRIEKSKQDFTEGVQTIKKRQWFSLKEYLRKQLSTNILDFIFSSFEIMQSEVAKKETQLADVVLHPDTTGLHWMELHRAEDFAIRGQQEAQRHIAEIKNLIAQ
ncbi:MAG: cyclic nucleotide-binding domain-containing protein [Candidatus Omnitrophica bacterium]|nr:cyclic nucleotide-binding domain-containing protein [Candidatus Omnitrophota bacterium]